MKIKHSDYPVKGTKSQLKLIEKKITFNGYEYKSYTRLLSWHRTIGNKQIEAETVLDVLRGGK